MRRLALAALLAAACGGSQPQNAVEGLVNNKPISVRYAFAFAPGAGNPLAVYLFDSPVSCDQLAGAPGPPNARGLLLIFAKGVGGGLQPPDRTGDYGITTLVFDRANAPDGPIAGASVGQFDAQCKEVKSQEPRATGGTATLSALSTAAGGRVAGSFVLVLESGDRIDGTFDTTVCVPPSQPSHTDCR